MRAPSFLDFVAANRWIVPMLVLCGALVLAFLMFGCSVLWDWCRWRWQVRRDRWQARRPGQ